MPSHSGGSHHSSSHSSSHHSTSHSSASHHTTIHPTHHNTSSTFGSSSGTTMGGRRRFPCIIPFLAVFLIVGGAIFFFTRGTIASIPSIANGSNSTSDAQAIQNDLKIMHAALDSRLTGWASTTDNIVHHVAYQDAGLPSDFNTKEVVYGHCASSGFYTFVLNAHDSSALDGTADTSGYAYTPKGDPGSCAPTGWTMTLNQNVASDWYYVNIDTKAATPKANAQ